MANNRMMLRCTVCGEESPCLAKYYPIDGWGECNTPLTDVLGWLSNHGHDHEATMWGPVHFETVFEVPKGGDLDVEGMRIV